MISSISVANFRGIEKIENLNFSAFNIFIGDNGTSKTTFLDAIHYSFSPNFLSGRIKHTDFFNGCDNPINITVNFRDSITVKLPDGYTEQEISCNKISLTIKKREKKTAGKVFSDIVTVEHLVLPDFNRASEKGWSIKRKSDSNFFFNERSLGLSQVTSDGMPRSFLFGKERDRQLQKGFNSSFSTIIDDLNWRFAKSVRGEQEAGNDELKGKIKAITKDIHEKIDFDKYEIFKEFRKRTSSFKVDDVGISILDSLAPFESSFLSTSRDILDLPVKLLGSGIEMIVSLLLLETLATMSKEHLIILIDEPELHLHPKLQQSLADYLLEISKKGHQVFVTTHSPIFFSNCIKIPEVKLFVSNKKDHKVEISEMSFGSGLFPWSPSWGEVNFYAYQFPTIEFHDELYGYIQELQQVFREHEVVGVFDKFGVPRTRNWTREKDGKALAPSDVPLQVFIRNKVHHPENKAMSKDGYNSVELKESIEQMIKIVKALKT